MLHTLLIRILRLYRINYNIRSLCKNVYAILSIQQTTHIYVCAQCVCFPSYELSF